MPSYDRGTTHSTHRVTAEYCRERMIICFLICQLHTAAKLSKYVQLLHPRSKNSIKDGTKCQVTGWGATNPDVLESSDTLQEVTVTVISRKVCNSQSYYNHRPAITKDMICAGDANGQKDSCQVRIVGSDRHCRGLCSTQSSVCPFPQGRGVENTESRVQKTYSPCLHSVLCCFSFSCVKEKSFSKAGKLLIK